MSNNIELVNNTLTAHGYEPLPEQSAFYEGEVDVFDIWEEENAEEKLRLLVKNKVFTEGEVLDSIFFFIDNWEGEEELLLNYEDCPLVRILDGLERDGTLIYNDSDHIHYYCYDAYGELIETIVKLGGEIDKNRLLYTCHVDGRYEDWIFNYLLDNFTFDKQVIANSAARLIRLSFYTEGDHEVKKSFQRLTEIGIDINTYFDENSTHSEDKCYLAIVFMYDIELFKHYLNEIPEQSTINQFAWKHIVYYMTEEHVATLSRMLEMGYQLPLEEIADYLAERDKMFDIAAQVRALI